MTIFISIIITGIIATGIHYSYKFFRFLWKEEARNPDRKWGKVSIKIDKIIGLIFKIWMISLLWWLVFMTTKLLLK